ncbi:response regulator transcription factor [Nocardioides sp. S-58]|uniref:Response regulator transcription factor n=1 Tax=Nocardioides renjunii TaxID=3095075 RepID=A0ABU5K8G0_9ACTN|nr:response regulator transcription factor [Nocardioides sp. S-58]MDZ5661251.1 response regulator transcription factor [Nocardioides sp. S-58]
MNERTAVVVEDDHDVGDAISALLDQAGFDVVVARTGAEALTIISEGRPDLVTLDLSLPDIDGVEVCRQIRTVSDCYVIVISARTAEVDRLIGLEVGADDYLVKPFSMRELQARVAALFRRPRSSEALVPAGVDAAHAVVAHRQQAARPTTTRSTTGWPAPAPDPSSPHEPASGSVGCDDLSLNQDAREVLVLGEEVDLTRTEFDLLAHLVTNPGVVVPREELMRAVWATDFVPDSTHVVDVHLANLRRKLRAAAADNQWIRTIRGVGFRFDPCCS